MKRHNIAKGLCYLIGIRFTPLCRALSVAFLLCFSFSVHAQQNNKHIQFSVGALYKRGFDASVALEHSTRYHNSFELFATLYLQYSDDPSANHITRHSFWKDYNTWHVGFAYKPCVVRGRNHYGNIRLGGSGGSDFHKFLGGIHVGYEHNFVLKRGWKIFFLVKEDVVIKARDISRTGASVGVKVPL